MMFPRIIGTANSSITAVTFPFVRLRFFIVFSSDQFFHKFIRRIFLYIFRRIALRDLSAHKVNVLDISQTIIDGFFNMMMIVDYSNADEEFGTVVDDLDKLGEEIGVRIRCQREEIFTKMHRV